MKQHAQTRRKLVKATAIAALSLSLWSGGIAPQWNLTPATGHSYAAAATTNAPSSVVRPNQVYSYSVLSSDLTKLAARYPELIKRSSIGTSEYGRELYSFELGKGPAIILLNGSHHAREWMTTIWLMAMTEYYAKAYEENASWNGLRVRDLLDHVTFRIVPMVNPDGVTLQQQGLSAFPAADRPALTRMNDGSTNFSRWKANGKGVDLNRQYPADWSHISNPASAPHYMNFKGTAPLQAKESQAMANLTKMINPELAISYHTAGEIVYWNFHTLASNLNRDRAIATSYAAMTGYRLVAPTANPSGGGFTDWFITQFHKPALTPELGRANGNSHVPLSEWNRIWGQNRDTGWMFAERAYSLWMGGQKAAQAAGAIRLTRTEASYASPELRAKPLGSIFTGKYTQLRTKGDWVEIKVPGGSRWINAKYTLTGPFDPITEPTVIADQAIPLFQSPLDAKPIQKTLAAGIALPVIEKWKTWLLVKTPSGSYWVKASSVHAVPAKPTTPEPETKPEQPTNPEPAGETPETTVDPNAPSENPATTADPKTPTENPATTADPNAPTDASGAPASNPTNE
ncbi:peptidase M14 carboxypeptidase A [Paenibacillus curdlanolyticus YK9]|uniref:Peptidase M14 carboxypeptidase A n=1 Tax=Paenibacillus curdlanolyticus YK9 TaxID=717606 RepID=E0I6Q4_9BACL|nr:M14 family metallocarboxypeptidase [Paenibacillus curdlanolyticus]EFM11720.1 peptidase M14 carboxypeptidase A [Paenibacillus curdlanolyticus YK9]